MREPTWRGGDVLQVCLHLLDVLPDEVGHRREVPVQLAAQHGIHNHSMAQQHSVTRNGRQPSLPTRPRRFPLPGLYFVVCRWR